MERVIPILYPELGPPPVVLLMWNWFELKLFTIPYWGMVSSKRVLLTTLTVALTAAIASTQWIKWSAITSKKFPLLHLRGSSVKSPWILWKGCKANLRPPWPAPLMTFLLIFWHITHFSAICLAILKIPMQPKFLRANHLALGYPNESYYTCLLTFFASFYQVYLITVFHQITPIPLYCSFLLLFLGIFSLLFHWILVYPEFLLWGLEPSLCSLLWTQVQF